MPAPNSLSSTVSQSEKGNVLFLILIAVVLFAALSFAVTGVTRGTGSSVSNEKANMYASRVLAFMAKLDAAVSRILIANGIQVYDAIYTTPVYKNQDGTQKITTPAISSNPGRAVFNPGDSGIAPETFADFSDNSIIVSGATMAGHVALFWLQIPGVGTTTADATAWVVSINASVCTAINQKVGLSSAPVFNNATTNSAIFAGTTSAPTLPAMAMSASDRARITGMYDFCARMIDGRYVYIHTFMPY